MVELTSGYREEASLRLQSALVREGLAPAVELPALTPQLLQGRTDTAVTAGRQALDVTGIAVVVTVADRCGGSISPGTVPHHRPHHVTLSHAPKRLVTISLG